MKLFKGLFNFYLNSSIHVALAICSLVAITVIEYNLNLEYAVLGFIFFGSITGYNFVKYAAVAGLHHRTLAASLKTIQVFSFIAFGLMLVCMSQLSIKTLFVAVVFGMVTFLYAVPLLKRKNLRTFGGIKILVVALVWAGVTVFVPMIADNMRLETDCWITFFQRILIVIVLLLPFEIRDLQFDSIVLKTFPQQLGVKNTKFVGVVLLGISLLLYGFKDEISWFFFTPLCIACLCMAVVLLFAKEKQSPYFSSFWVEGIPIIWFALLLGFRHFFL